MFVEMDSSVAHNDTNVLVLPQKNKARILIVDDEDDIRFALARILNLEGYRADEAASGKMALTRLAQNSYDLVVLDMRMPEMSGVEVMQYLDRHYPDLMVIVLTGQATLDSAITATKMESVVNYLLKPAHTDEMISAVKAALKKKLERQRQQNLVTAAAQVLSVMHPPTPDLNNLNTTPPPPSPQSERFLQIYPLTLDRKKRLVTIMDENPVQLIELTKGETAILSILLTYANRTLSCYQLVRMALGYEIDESEAESVIRPYIFRLRRKLETNPSKPCLICTVRRRGYRFNSPNT